MRAIIALLLMSSPAAAQTVYTFDSCVSQDGSTAWTSTWESCAASGGVFHKGAPVFGGGPINNAVVSGGNTYITNVTKNCPNDRTLVMVSGGSYKCAKDLTDPE